MKQTVLWRYMLASLVAGSFSTTALAEEDKIFTNTGSAVPVVCLADNIGDVNLGLFGGLLGLFDISEDELKNTIPPVGSGHFLPAGTGFVVGEDEESSYVVTNWHVFSACNAGKSGTKDYLQVGVLEATGKEIQSISADPVLFKKEQRDGETLYIPAPVRAICTDEATSCPSPLSQKPVSSPDGVKFLSEEQQQLIEMYAPDIAVLKLRNKIAIKPATLDVKDKIETKEQLEAFGFPYTTMIGNQARDKDRHLITQPNRSALFYSGESPITNEKFGMKRDDIINIDLQRVSGSLYSGNSGSPIVLDDGLVVGMATLSHETHDSAQVTPSKDIVKMLEFLGVPHDTNAATNIAPPPPPPPPPPPFPIKWIIGICLAAMLLMIMLAIFFISNRKKRATDAHHPQPPQPQPQRQPTTGTVPIYNDAVVTLKIMDGVHKGDHMLPLPNGSSTLVLGRNPDVCNLVYPKNTPGISAEHCTFKWDATSQRLSVRDESTYGVFVNGQKIVKHVEVPLQHDDTVDLGAAGKNSIRIKTI